MQEQGKWVTINGAHVFVKDGQSPMDAFIRKSTPKLYRAGTNKGVMESGTFFSPNEQDAGNYGNAQEYKLDNSAKLYEGVNTQNYAKENKLMEVKNDLLKSKLGVSTLKEVEDIYQNWITPSYLDKNPNLYYFAYQYMARKDLESKGYDGAHWENEDELTPEQYQVWNENKFKIRR